MEDKLILNIDSHAIDERERRRKEEANRTFAKRFVFDANNYLNTTLREGEMERELRVRILPISPTNPDFVMCLKLHSVKVNREVSKSGFKKYVCLNDPNIEDHDERGCPFCRKSRELMEEANKLTDPKDYELKKELLRTAYSLQAKDAYIVRVIERGKEGDGVKFWRFNHRTDGLGIYDKLINLNNKRREEAELAGQKNYSIFDLMNGKDITITLKKYVPASGKAPEKTTIDIMDSGFQTPLSNDINLANKWISDTKSWKDVYSLKDYEYLDIVMDGGTPVFDTASHKWMRKDETIPNTIGMTYSATPVNNPQVVQQNQPNSNGSDVPEFGGTYDLPF